MDIGVGRVWADLAALSAFADGCGRLAGAVRSAGAPPPAGPAFQPSSAAVAAVHGAADTVEEALACRLEWTGRTVARAGAGYAATDAHNAAGIGAVAL